MSRPLRIEFEGFVHHVTSPGDRCDVIFEGDEDRAGWLAVVALGVERFGANLYACWLICSHSKHPRANAGECRSQLRSRVFMPLRHDGMA